jgi:hypothetical protein
LISHKGSLKKGGRPTSISSNNRRAIGIAGAPWSNTERPYPNRPMAARQDHGCPFGLFWPSTRRKPWDFAGLPEGHPLPTLTTSSADDL